MPVMPFLLPYLLNFDRKSARKTKIKRLMFLIKSDN